MAFGGAVVPEGHVVRTFRVKVMSAGGKRERCFALLEDAGDVWAWCIDRFHDRLRQGLPGANSVTGMWPDQKAHGPFGDLTAHCAQDVTKGFSAAFFGDAAAASGGEGAAAAAQAASGAGHLAQGRVPADRAGARRARAVLLTRRGAPNLEIALSHGHRYDPRLVRALRLVDEAGELFLDITAWVAVIGAGGDRGTVAGVDPGIICPLAVASGDRALLVSGRAVRAEEFLHLHDQQLRQRKMARKKAPVRGRPGAPRQAGSRRWAKIAARQRKADARNRRVAKTAANTAANLAAQFIVDQARAGTVAVGDPRGVRRLDAGPVHNRRTHRWLLSYTTGALTRRLEECAVTVVLVDERGTSSHCPDCGAGAAKRGRVLTCTSPCCGRVHHRDVAGARNIAGKAGHAPAQIAHTEHRRVGQPARRDRRRHRYDDRNRSEQPAPAGPARTRAAEPATTGEESLAA